LKNPKIGFITCVHPIYKLPAVIQHRDNAVAGLRAAGCDVVVPETARDSRDVPEIVAALKREDIDLLVFFFCTWVAEEITLGLAREMESVPLLLWALPYFDKTIPMPSPMTGLTATGCNIRRMGRSFLHRVGAATPEDARAVARTAQIAAVVKGLRQARFGMVGTQCPGMIDTGCDESLLQRRLGVTAVHRDVDNLLRAGQESSAEEARELAVGLMERVGGCEVALETVADQCRLYLGMKSMVEADHMDGFSVRCWPELRDHHKSPICLTMAVMAEAGVPAACEADLTSLVTSYVLTRLAGLPSYSVEVTGFLKEEGALQLAHCGAAALSLAGDPKNATIRGHMRTGAGALIEFGFQPGTITIAKLLRPEGDRLKMFIGRGEVIPTAPGTRGSVATVRVEPSPEAFLDTMLQEAVEHHLVLVYGDWTKDLAEFAKLAGIECVEALRR
jgi:L-fucose isomerase-like protein